MNWSDLARSAAKTSGFFGLKTLGGAAIGGMAGYQLRGPDEEQAGFRVLAGAALGGLYGGFLGSKFGRNAAFFKGKSQLNRLTNHFGAMPGKFGAAKAAGAGMFEAMNSSYLSLPALTLAGGLYKFGEARREGTDPAKGLLTGLAMGAAAKAGLHGVQAWSALGKKGIFGKGAQKTSTAVMGLGLTPLVAAYGMSQREYPNDTFASTPDPYSGSPVPTQQMEYQEQNPLNMGLKGRLDSMGARGDIVMGLGRRRHG